MYVKIFSDILQSSIWAEDSDTCKVWITMLALANQDGLVRATAPGISHEARVSMERTIEILKILESPDDQSRTPDNEGRRISRTDGGYLILNYMKYRDMKKESARREQWKEASKRYYDKHKGGHDSQQSSSNLITPQQNSSQAEAEAEAEVIKPPCRAKSATDGVSPKKVAEEIISDLNRITGKRFNASSLSTFRLILARLRDDFTTDDFKKVHATKAAQWRGTEQEKYLRPSTLYAAKHFEEYLNEAPASKATAKVNPETGEGVTWG